jgi:hypothetical protein
MIPRTFNAISATVTRPADTTAYASGDLVANSTTAGSVTPLSFTDFARAGAGAKVRRVRIDASKADITNASFRVHLYTSSPTVANGDNGAISSTASGWVGSVDVTVGQLFSNGASGAATTEINAKATTLYGLIEARGAYTPASGGTFTVTLEVEQN